MPKTVKLEIECRCTTCGSSDSQNRTTVSVRIMEEGAYNQALDTASPEQFLDFVCPSNDMNLEVFENIDGLAVGRVHNVAHEWSGAVRKVNYTLERTGKFIPYLVHCQLMVCILFHQQVSSKVYLNTV